jgi:hypothetical protein
MVHIRHNQRTLHKGIAKRGKSSVGTLLWNGGVTLIEEPLQLRLQHSTAACRNQSQFFGALSLLHIANATNRQ